MKWTTRNHLHLDRTASAWLIARFVDADAEFDFIDWDTAPDANDPGYFGMPGIALSNHDQGGTCFAKIIKAHRLEDDAALVQLERGIAAGVRHAMNLPIPAEQSAAETELGNTLDNLGLGLSILHGDDEHLAAATPLYDAVYTYMRLAELPEAELPTTQPERIAHLRGSLGIR